jgi:transposase
MLIWFIVTLRVKTVVYVDESGVEEHHCRIKCRAKRGVKVYATRPGRKLKKTNIVAGLLYGHSGRKHIAAHCYSHSTNAAFFEDWFEWQLLSETPEGSLIIMDNASFHRKNKLFELASKHGVYILFLPPYSPEFNPIEQSWANLKQWLKSNASRFPSLNFALNSYFYY